MAISTRLVSSVRTFKTPPVTLETAPPPKPPRKSWPLKKYLPWMLIASLALISLFLYLQFRQAKKQLSANNNSAAVTSLVSQLGRIIILPTGETPTIATVTHADKLQNQRFFIHAKDGDKVIIYTKHDEAILYRPSTKQIVTVSNINITGGPAK